MHKISKAISFATVFALFFVMAFTVQGFSFDSDANDLPDVNYPLYVDGTNGSDGNHGQSPDKPFQRITKAVEYANMATQSNYQILISEGDYDSGEMFPWELEKEISFFGGYYNDFQNRDLNNRPTQIKGITDHGALMMIKDVDSRISGLRFYNHGGSSLISPVIVIDTSGTGNNSVSVTESMFTNCRGTGGVVNGTTSSGDELTIKNNFISNHSSTMGTIGAVIASGGSDSMVISENFFYRNKTAINAENALISNNIISNNNSGTGLYLRQGSKAYHNTIVNNLNGVEVRAGDSGIEFINNIVAYNTISGTFESATHDYNSYHANGSLHTLENNDLNCDPKFNNTDSENVDDYMLRDNSTCIDAGTEIAEVSFDYFGNERKLDGNNDAIYASDPGAHEAYGEAAAAPVISNASANPNVFSPDGDGINDTSTISFDLNVTSNIVVNIYDGTDIINQLINELRGSGTHNVVWNGENTLGDTMPEGTYTYKITAQNSEGATEFNGNVTIDMNATSNYCAGYPDVAFNDPLCPAISYVTDQGIFEGYPDGTFRPNDVINRVETTKVILEGFNIPLLPDDGTNLGFIDVIIGEWYMTYLRTGKEEGIIQGYPDNTFRPNQQVNRVEMLKIFLETSDVDLSGVTITEDPYPDTPVTGDTSWYMTYVQFSKDYALVDADASGNFNPAQGMKRGDVADLFYRFHQEGFI